MMACKELQLVRRSRAEKWGQSWVKVSAVFCFFLAAHFTPVGNSQNQLIRAPKFVWFCVKKEVEIEIESVLYWKCSMGQISMELTRIARGPFTHARISKRDLQSLSNPIQRAQTCRRRKYKTVTKHKANFVVHENASYECRRDYIIWISSRALRERNVKQFCCCRSRFCAVNHVKLSRLLRHSREFLITHAKKKTSNCFANNQLDVSMFTTMLREQPKALTINICLSLRSLLERIKASDNARQ